MGTQSWTTDAIYAALSHTEQGHATTQILNADIFFSLSLSQPTTNCHQYLYVNYICIRSLRQGADSLSKRGRHKKVMKFIHLELTVRWVAFSKNACFIVHFFVPNMANACARACLVLSVILLADALGKGLTSRNASPNNLRVRVVVIWRDC